MCDPAFRSKSRNIADGAHERVSFAALDRGVRRGGSHGGAPPLARWLGSLWRACDVCFAQFTNVSKVAGGCLMPCGCTLCILQQVNKSAQEKEKIPICTDVMITVRNTIKNGMHL